MPAAGRCDYLTLPPLQEDVNLGHQKRNMTRLLQLCSRRARSSPVRGQSAHRPSFADSQDFVKAEKRTRHSLEERLHYQTAMWTEFAIQNATQPSSKPAGRKALGRSNLRSAFLQ